MSKKTKAYYEQPWWKNRIQVMDLQAPLEGRPLTAEDWGKMHSDAIATTDAKLKAEWDAKRKEKTTLKRLFKELKIDKTS
tara:strand:- start:302 stop:541 length:240 start_codon:yes stop_codon:yes gene_type:complete